MNIDKLYKLWSITKKNLDYIINNRKYSSKDETLLIKQLSEINKNIEKINKNIEPINVNYQNNYIVFPYNDFIFLWYNWIKKRLNKYIEKTLKIKDNNLVWSFKEDLNKHIIKFLNSSILKFNYLLEWIDPKYLIDEWYIKTINKESVILEIPINEILIVSPENKNKSLYYTFDKNENLYSNKSIQFFSQYKKIKNGEIIFIEDQLWDLPDIWFRFNKYVFLLNNIDYSIKQLTIKWNFKWVEYDLKIMTNKLKKIII